MDSLSKRPVFYLFALLNLAGLAGVILGALHFANQNRHGFYSRTAEGGLWIMFLSGLLGLVCYRVADRFAPEAEARANYHNVALAGIIGCAMSAAIIVLQG
jgi:hypothetical protein